MPHSIASQPHRQQGRQDLWVSLDSSLSSDSDPSRLSSSHLGSLPAICSCSGGVVCSVIICCPSAFSGGRFFLVHFLIHFLACSFSPLISFSQAKGSLRSLTVQGSHICRSDSETAFVVLFSGGGKVTVYFICACICNLVLCLYWGTLEKGPSCLLAGLITVHHAFKEFLQQVVLCTFFLFFFSVFPLFMGFFWFQMRHRSSIYPSSSLPGKGSYLISVCTAFRGRIGLAAKNFYINEPLAPFSEASHG